MRAAVPALPSSPRLGPWPGGLLALGALTAAALLCACDNGDGDGDGASDPPPPLARPACGSYGPVQPVASVTDPALVEVSGLAASRRSIGGVWVHNDAGHEPVLHALRGDGRARVRIRLDGAAAEDWEDVAIGPCEPLDPERGAGDDLDARFGCLWVADTGDNTLEDPGFTLLLVEEPDVPAGTVGGLGVTVQSWPADRWVPYRFDWPDGPRDVEAMAVTADGRAVLFTRPRTEPDASELGTSEVWRVDPFVPDTEPGRVARVGLLDVGEALELGETEPRPPITAADLSDDGRFLLVRTPDAVLTYDVRGGLSEDDAADVQAAVDDANTAVRPSGYDEQGEALGWAAPETGGYWHTSERTGSVTPKLWRVQCDD